MTQDPQRAAAFHALMRERRSARAFEVDRPVPQDVLESVLTTASHAPSNSNTQPWQLHVLTGDALHALSSRLRAACDSGEAPPFSHFPDVLPARMSAHQGDFGARYYAALGIDRSDDAARNAQTLRNYEFFGAPLGMLMTIDRRLRAHSWLDCGLFLQSLLLALQAHGLAACPQVSFARFSELIRQHLSLPSEDEVVCGISVGYAASQAPVNNFEMPRRAVSEIAHFHVGWPSVAET